MFPELANANLCNGEKLMVPQGERMKTERVRVGSGVLGGTHAEEACRTRRGEITKPSEKQV